MPLSATQVKQAKARDKAYKLSDEKGMFLLVNPNGSKYWRLKYRFGGKEKLLALGVYPDVSLKDARNKRDAARSLLANGADPGKAKKAQKAADVLEVFNAQIIPAGEPGPADFEGPAPAPPAHDQVDGARAEVQEMLGPAPVTVDEIVRNSQFSPAAVSVVLLELELAGRLERHPGNQVSLIADP